MIVCTRVNGHAMGIPDCGGEGRREFVAHVAFEDRVVFQSMLFAVICMLYPRSPPRKGSTMGRYCLCNKPQIPKARVEDILRNGLDNNWNG